MGMLTKAQRLQVYDAIIEKRGTRYQIVVAIEELAEAQKELTKFLRGIGNFDRLREEVQDAKIVLEQVEHILKLNDCEKILNSKILRTIEREHLGHHDDKQHKFDFETQYTDNDSKTFL